MRNNGMCKRSGGTSLRYSLVSTIRQTSTYSNGSNEGFNCHSLERAVGPFEAVTRRLCGGWEVTWRLHGGYLLGEAAANLEDVVEVLGVVLHPALVDGEGMKQDRDLTESLTEGMTDGMT